MNKGDYGYMNHYKRMHFIISGIFVVFILALVIAAHFIDDKLVSTICFVVAAVSSLPAAKHIVAVIVVASFHTMDEQTIEDLDEHTRDAKTGLALYDVTLATPEAMLYSPYVYLTDNMVYCLLIQPTNRITSETLHATMNKIVVNAGFPVEIKIVHNISEMNKILEELEDVAENNVSMLEKMKEQILVYNV